MATPNPDDPRLADPGPLPEIGAAGLRNFRPSGQYRATMMIGMRNSPLELRLLIVINLAIVVAIVAALVLK
jgi:hypothetical protein